MTGPDRHEPTVATRRRRRAACWLAAISMLGVAACGGDDTATTTDPTAAPTTEPPATTAATTTEPPVESTTSTTTTTTTTTTLAPTTTDDPTAAVAAEVEAAYLEANDLRYAALSDPMDDETVEEALKLFADPMRSTVSETIQEMRENGYGAIENPDVPWSVVVEQGPTPAEGLARLVSCTVDPWIVVETGAGPSGSDAIVDDNVYLYRNAVTLHETSSGWKVAETEELGFWTGLDTCPAG